LLFERYPLLHKKHKHTLEFSNIYEQTTKQLARRMILEWKEKTKNIEIKEFHTAANSLNYNMEKILNFFTNRSITANAESFNAKIKLFREI